jgi:hypothetical protein
MFSSFPVTFLSSDIFYLGEGDTGVGLLRMSFENSVKVSLLTPANLLRTPGAAGG